MFESITPGAKASAFTNFLQLDVSAEIAAQKMLDFLSERQIPWQPDAVTLDRFQVKKPAIPILINNLKRQLADGIARVYEPNPSRSFKIKRISSGTTFFVPAMPTE
jgi:hypothetical protein